MVIRVRGPVENLACGKGQQACTRQAGSLNWQIDKMAILTQHTETHLI